MQLTLRQRLVPFVVVFAALVLVFGAPDVLACPVCDDVKDKNRGMYYLTAWLLTFVPLLSVGGFIAFLIRRARRLEAEAAIAPPAE